MSKIAKANIWNTHEIERYLRSFSPQDKVIADLLVLALFKPLKMGTHRSKKGNTAFNMVALNQIPENAPKWLVEKWNQSDIWHHFVRCEKLDRKVRCVLFWLKTAAHNREPWFTDFLEKGKDSPRKPSFQSVNQAAKVAREKIKKSGFNRSYLFSEREIDRVHDFTDGMGIYQLLTKDALKDEAEGNDNCVDDSTHVNNLYNNKNLYFSLRDCNGEPRATIHVHPDGEVIEIRGRSNNPVTIEDEKYLLAFINRYELYINNKSCREHGFYYDHRDEKIYSVRNLPHGAVIYGDLNLVDYTDVLLPYKLTVKGLLTLRGSDCPLVGDCVSANEIQLRWKADTIFHHDNTFDAPANWPLIMDFHGELHTIRRAYFPGKDGRLKNPIIQHDSIKKYQHCLRKPPSILQQLHLRKT